MDSGHNLGRVMREGMSDKIIGEEISAYTEFLLTPRQLLVSLVPAIFQNKIIRKDESAENSCNWRMHKDLAFVVIENTKCFIFSILLCHFCFKLYKCNLFKLKQTHSIIF